MGFTAYIWQKNAITTLTLLDEKKQNSFHSYNLDSSETCRLSRLCTTSTQPSLVYGFVEWERTFFFVCLFVELFFFFTQGASTKMFKFVTVAWTLSSRGCHWKFVQRTGRNISLMHSRTDITSGLLSFEAL